MKTCFSFLVLFMSVIANAQKKSSAKEIFDIEKQFSDDSKNEGFLSANLKYAADEALVFRPRLINAREWTNSLKGTDSSYQITWYPSDIEVSSAGDLGFATGPFDNVSKIKGDSSENHGQFLTIWKRQADGQLKFVMDFGSNQLPHSEFVKKEPVFIIPDSDKKKNKSNGKVEQKEKLISLEKEFAKECLIHGELNSYKKFASDNISFFYQRQFYVKGLEKALDRIDPKGSHHWKLINGEMAESGDLAYAYGTHEFKSGDELRTGYWLRIWRKNKCKWKIIAQVRSLLPK